MLTRFPVVSSYLPCYLVLLCPFVASADTYIAVCLFVLIVASTLLPSHNRDIGSLFVSKYRCLSDVIFNVPCSKLCLCFSSLVQARNFALCTCWI